SMAARFDWGPRSPNRPISAVAPLRPLPPPWLGDHLLAQMTPSTSTTNTTRVTVAKQRVQNPAPGSKSNKKTNHQKGASKTERSFGFATPVSDGGNGPRHPREPRPPYRRQMCFPRSANSAAFFAQLRAAKFP